MIVLVNTDHNIKKQDGLVARITSSVEGALKHRSDHITRIEVHVTDEDGERKKSQHQMRCVIEAKLEGRGALAVTHRDISVGQAVDGAAAKMVRWIDHTLGRAHDIAVHSR